MTTLPNVNFAAGRPVRADELAEIINQDRAKINSLPAANLQKTEAGKVQIDIEGDAGTVGGLTAGEIAGADFAVFAKTLAEMLVNESGLVISGGEASKNSGTANQLDITAIVAIQKDDDGKLDRVELGAAAAVTATGSTTYYLDLVPGAVSYTWDTSHATAPYIPIAQVTTDGSGNISTVTDARPTALAFFDGLDPEPSEGLELGETSATAYRGDYGATAYAHSQVATGPVHGAESAATAGKMVVRDASSRARFADPSHAQDAANKGYVDTAEASAKTYVDALTQTRIAVLTAAGAVPKASNGAEKKQISGTNHEYYVLAFDKAADEFAYFDFVVPPDYNGGTITMKFFWAAPTLNTGAVVWNYNTLSRGSGNAWDSALGTTRTVTQTTAGTALNLNVASFTAASPGWTAGHAVIVRVSRDADHASDTLNEDAHFLMAEIQYTGK